MIYAENILICIVGPLIVALAFTKDKTKRFIGAFVVGMLACLFAAYIGGFWELKAALGREDTSIFISPVVEEIVKFIPMLLYVFLCQLLAAGSESLPYILIRGFAVGIMHIVSVLTMTFAFIMLRRKSALSVAVIMGGLSLSTSVHSLYNLLVSAPGLSSYIGYVLPLTMAVILYFIRKRIAR